MAFPSNPSDKDEHTENNVVYRYSSKNALWYRTRRHTHLALEQALKDIEDRKSRITALEG